MARPSQLCPFFTPLTNDFNFSQVNIAWITNLTKRFLPYSNTGQVTDFIIYFTKPWKRKQNPKKESCWITVLSKWVITFILIHKRQKENPQLNFYCAKFPKVHQRRKKSLINSYAPIILLQLPTRRNSIHPLLLTSATELSGSKFPASYHFFR